MGQYESDVNELLLIEGSLCTHCTHMISRTVLPLDYENYGIDKEEIVLPDGTEAPIIHTVCIKLNMDLDHVVLNCNKFEDQRANLVRIGSGLFFKEIA